MRLRENIQTEGYQSGVLVVGSSSREKILPRGQIPFLIGFRIPVRRRARDCSEVLSHDPLLRPVFNVGTLNLSTYSVFLPTHLSRGETYSEEIFADDSRAIELLYKSSARCTFGWKVQRSHQADTMRMYSRQDRVSNIENRPATWHRVRCGMALGGAWAVKPLALPPI